MSELLSPQQRHEANVRMNGLPMSKPLPEVFSAQLAKQITRSENLVFHILCIQNLLEQGCPELALKKCKEALK